MSSDVHLGRGAAGGKLGARKASYDMSGGYEYYDEGGQEWWDEEGTAHAGYDAMAAGNQWGTYYDEFSGEALHDNFEIDLHSLVFTLNENLEPQDFYVGMEVDDKSFLITLQEEDIDEHMPPAWKSRPLKIHPEPAPRTERKEQPGLGGILDAAPSTGTAQASSPGTTPPPHSPVSNHRDGIQTSHRSENEATSPGEAVTPKSPGSNPKIVISHGQLLNLKEKMQALKQRRSITPMELPPAQDKAGPDDESSKTDGKESNNRNSKEKPPITSNCPGAHGLKLFNTPDSGWWCSVCETEHAKGTAFFGCRECDYDECETCARAPVASKKKKKQEKKVRSGSSSPQVRNTSAASPVRSNRKDREVRSASAQSPVRSNRKEATPKTSKDRVAVTPAAAASEKKAAEACEDDSPSEDAPLRRDNRREKRRDEEDTKIEKKRNSTAKRGDDDRREVRAERAEKRASTTKDAERDGRAEAKLSKASLRESTAASSSAAKPRRAGAALASAALAAAASAAGRNTQAASPASDEGSSSEEEYQAPRDARRGVRDSRLVPRDKRQAQPEHWDPRDRQESREVSEDRASASSTDAAVRRGARMRSDQSQLQAGLKRRAPPERPAPQNASRSRSASEEPLPKKRAGNNSLVSNEDLPHNRGSASSSASSLRAAVRAPVSSDEAPRAAARRAAPRGESSNDLLRRVLGAHRMGFPAGQQKRPIRGNASTPVQEMSPEPVREPVRATSNSKGSSARDGAAVRTGGGMAGIRKALESVKKQDFQVEARKSRRV